MLVKRLFLARVMTVLMVCAGMVEATQRDKHTESLQTVSCDMIKKGYRSIPSEHKKALVYGTVSFFMMCYVLNALTSLPSSEKSCIMDSSIIHNAPIIYLDHQPTRVVPLAPQGGIKATPESHWGLEEQGYNYKRDIKSSNAARLLERRKEARYKKNNR